MLLSRFWYVFLSVTAAAATAAAILAQGIINDRFDRSLEDQLRRDRFELEAMLRLEARSRLDRIAFASVDAKLGSMLRQVRNVEDDGKLREASSALKDVLRGHVDQLIDAAPGEGTRDQKRARVAPDIVFALDVSGRIIAQLGPMEANPPGSALSTFPLVKRALQGYVRDDVWVYDRRVYRMAARPVMDGGAYAGAIVHGYRFDQELVDTLAKNLDGATVAFYYAGSVLATFSPEGVEGAPEQAELIAPLEQVFVDEKFKAGQRTDVVALQGGARAVYSRVTGTAAAANVGYVIARPRSVIASPLDLFKNASEDDVERLPKPLLAGGAVVAFLFGLLFMYLERDRPFKQLATKTLEIGKGERERLVITEWRGAYRRLADAINQAIDKEVDKAAASGGGASRKKAANIDEILGPAQTGGGGFFGFAKEEEPPSSPSTPAVVAPAAPVPAAAPAAPPSSPKLSPAVPVPVPAPASSPRLAPAAPKVAPVIKPAAPVLPTAPPAAAAPVPAAAPHLTVPPAPAEEFDQESHFHEVFEQYVNVRQQCGEEIDSLKFEKFVLTLRKNRDQIVAKHNCESVRFTVYVKDGKAALKAAPIKP